MFMWPRSSPDKRRTRHSAIPSRRSRAFCNYKP
jgi:hypothetical protein